MKYQVNRRKFLKEAAALSVFSIVPAHVLRAETAPSNQLTRAIIGFGAIAHTDAHLGYRGSRLIAMCDVDSQHLTEGLNCAKNYGYGKIRGCRDFRDILNMPDVDVVHICTPPHWHGLISYMAAKAGKDIWCEKPMTRTLGEGIKVAKAVHENGRMYRINTWFRFSGGFYGFGTTVKPLKKIVENRLLGWPLRVVVGPSQGFDFKFWVTGFTNLKPEPIPACLDYNMWLGPAPYRPYNHHRVHWNFRGYWDYEGGGFGDMGQHYLDPVQYILEKDDESPIRVDVDCPPQHPDVVGYFNRIVYTYADGCQIILDGDNSLAGAPYLEGPKGAVWPHLRSNIPNLTKIIDELPDPAPQQTDFADSVRTRRPFALNENTTFRSNTLVRLGLAAMRVGHGFNFDSVNLRAINEPAVDRLLREPMRKPWTM